MAGRFDDILAGLSSSTATVPAPSANSSRGKYGDILASINRAPSGTVPYKPTALESAADLIRSGQEVLAPAFRASEKLQEISMPDLAMANKASGLAGAGIDELEGRLAESLGGAGVNPYVAAGGIKAAELAAQLAMPTPRGLMSGMAKPVSAATAGIGKRALSATLGPSVEAISERAANPEAVAGAATHLQLAETLPSVVKNISQKITTSRDKATSFLRDSPNPRKGAIPRSMVQNLLKTIEDSLQVEGATVSEASKAASSKLQGLFSDIGKILEPRPSALESKGILGPKGTPVHIPRAEVFLPETSVKKLIDVAGKNINWEDKGATVANSALTDFQTRLNELLKSRNPQFAKAMKPVSALTRLYNDAIDSFSLTKKTGEGVQPTDTTISKISSLPQERKGISQGVARRMKAATGRDLTRESKLAGFRKQFESGRANGSRRVNLGSVVGAGVGGGAGMVFGEGPATATLGGVIGATAGALADSFGGQIAGKFIDNYARLTRRLSAAANKPSADVVRRMALNLTLTDLYQGDKGQE